MPKKLKYVVTDHLGYEAPFIFPDSINHNSFVMMLNASEKQVVSAGHIMLGPDGACCFGRSLSLGKSSREQDDSLINGWFEEK